MGFSRQDYWSGLPFPSPGDLPQPGIKAGSPALQADSEPFELPGKPIYLPNPLLKDKLFLAFNYYKPCLSKYLLTFTMA